MASPSRKFQVLRQLHPAAKGNSVSDGHKHDQDGHPDDHKGRSQGPGHVHAPPSFGTAFAIAVGLNSALVVAQVFYGVVANSVALLADAGHNFGDVIGLLMAWGAHAAARLPPTERYTYGFRSGSILASVFNGLILMVATGAIAWEAIGRLNNPEEVHGATIMVVAGIGIVVNGVSAWLLKAGDDLNVRGAFLHLVGDAAISAGVIAAGAAIYFTGWSWIDPVTSLVVAVVIVWATWGLLKQAFALSLGGVPQGIDRGEVEKFLSGLPDVACIHDLHIWAMSTTETALTCHLEMPGGRPGDTFLMGACSELQRRFKIGHATMQIETDHAAACPLKPDHVV